MGTAFAIVVTIIIAGVLWFHVVRPILEDWGVIRDGERVRGFEAGPAPAPPAQVGDRPSSAASSQRVDPPKTPGTSQPEPSDLAVLGPSRDPFIISHNMTKKELTILLAVQRDGDGAYRFSANRIAEFVGGTSAEVKGWVAEVRGRREPASSTMYRPTNGWGKAS